MNKVTVFLIIVGFILLYLHSNRKISDSFTNNPVRLKEYPNFLTNEECDAIIALSQEGLYDSTVYTEKSDIVNNEHRQSKQKWLYNNDHPVVQMVSDKVAKLTNTSKENQEPLQVVKYGKGGFFRPHYDAADGDSEFRKRLDGDAGPRQITVLIYLNDDFKGGETEFPNLKYKAKPKKGKAVVFYGTDNDGEIIRDSLHGGNPVEDGYKWVCNKWIRPRKYSPIPK